MRGRLLSIASALAFAAGTLTACGDGDDTGLAELAPPDVPFYGEVVARPDSEQREAIESFADNLGEPEPGAAVGAAVDGLFADNQLGITYADDVEPWLGERAAVFVLSFEMAQGSGFPDFALLAEVDDPEAASAFVDRVQEQDPSIAEDATYEGFEYASGGGGAVGIVEDTFILGSEAAFKVAVDAKNGESLAESEEYSERLDALEGDPIATVFVELGTAIEAAIASGDIPEAEAELVRPLLAGGLSGPIAAGLTATSEAASVDLVTTLDDTDAVISDPALLEGLPADAALALAAPELGAAIIRALDQLETSGIPGASALRDQIQAVTGLDLNEDVAAWLGDVSAFLSGSAERNEVAVGLIAETSDPDGPRALLDAGRSIIEREAPAAPVGPAPEGADYGFTVGNPVGVERLEAGVVGDRLVAAFGTPLAEVTDPEITLADDERYRDAAEALGSAFSPSLYAVLPQLLTFAQAGGIDEGRDYTEAIPYAEALGYLIAGARVEDGLVVGRFTVGNE